MYELKLNAACGTDHKDGYINLDYKDNPGVDVVMDLTKKLDFPDGFFDEIYTAHTLEHLIRWEDTVWEFWRILKVGGRLIIKVPHAPNYYTGHVRQFLPYTLNGFIEGKYRPMDWDGEIAQLFCQKRQYVNRRMWYEWHIERYLHVKWPFPSPIGRKYELVWELEKIDRKVED